FFSGIILAISALFNDTGGLAGNSSYTGAYLIFSFFIGGILLFVVRNVWRKILVSIGLIIILVIPFVIGARGAFGGLLAGILVAFFIYLALSGKKIIRVTGVTLLILSLVLTAFVGISLIQPTSRIHSEFEKAAGNSRFIFWKIALEGIKERPLLGWGPENYSVVYAKYFDPTILEPGEAREVSVDKPHNMVLEQFVSGGFIGGMLFLLFLILFFILPLYFYRKKIFSKMELALFTGLFFAYFLQDLIIFDTVITYMTLFVLFGIFTGTTLIFTQKEKIKTISGLKPIARTVHAIVCILLFIFSWIFFVHLPSKKAKGIYTLVSRKTAEKDFSVVASISPMGNGRDVGIIGERMVKSYQENIDTIKQDPRLIAQAHTDINSFLTEADKLTEAAPNDYALWLACAQLESFDMTSTGNFEDKAISRALSYIDRARELSPNDPRVYLVYGQIFAYQKEFAKAHDYLMKAYNLDPKIPVLKEYLDKFEKLFGTKL
ncbi:MAG TPA: O-antigen ligase family protein, partial [Candidatus Paceibacterota bacterium]|nr:O-antigen ligase family protein [Candidatus Paceibacterota bacterium]